MRGMSVVALTGKVRDHGKRGQANGGPCLCNADGKRLRLHGGTMKRYQPLKTDVRPNLRLRDHEWQTRSNRLRLFRSQKPPRNSEKKATRKNVGIEKIRRGDSILDR